MNAKVNESCRGMFKELGILTLYSQYIYSILMFVVVHGDIFIINNEVHGFNTRQKLNLHLPSVRLTKVKKGVYYAAVSIYNKLPNHIKEQANNFHQSRITLKRFLMNNPFYSIEEYLHNDTSDDTYILH